MCKLGKPWPLCGDPFIPLCGDPFIPLCGDPFVPTEATLGNEYDSVCVCVCMCLCVCVSVNVSVVISIISRSTVDCNSTTFQPRSSLPGTVYVMYACSMGCLLMCYLCKGNFTVAAM